MGCSHLLSAMETASATPMVHIWRYGSRQTGPLNAHQTTIFGWKGFWIHPSNLSELVCRWLQQMLLLKGRINNNWMNQGVLHNNHLSNQSTSIHLHPCRYIRTHIASQRDPNQCPLLPSHKAVSFVHHIRKYSLWFSPWTLDYCSQYKCIYWLHKMNNTMGTPSNTHRLDGYPSLRIHHRGLLFAYEIWKEERARAGRRNQAYCSLLI